MTRQQRGWPRPSSTGRIRCRCQLAPDAAIHREGESSCRAPADVVSADGRLAFAVYPLDWGKGFSESATVADWWELPNMMYGLFKEYDNEFSAAAGRSN